jgi:hypothetical protein
MLTPRDGARRCWHGITAWKTSHPSGTIAIVSGSSDATFSIRAGPTVQDDTASQRPGHKSHGVPEGLGKRFHFWVMSTNGRRVRQTAASPSTAESSVDDSKRGFVPIPDIPNPDQSSIRHTAPTLLEVTVVGGVALASRILGEIEQALLRSHRKCRGAKYESTG